MERSGIAIQCGVLWYASLNGICDRHVEDPVSGDQANGVSHGSRALSVKELWVNTHYPANAR